MPKQTTQKANNLLKLINEKEGQLFELIARYHLAFVGIDNPNQKVLEHTLNFVSTSFVRASIYFASITDREKAYLELASKGYKLKEIANYLKISISSAKTHRDLILQKLFSKNIAQACVEAKKYQIT